MVALAGVILRVRNYVSLGGARDVVEIRSAGRKTRYDASRLTFFVPPSPRIYAPYVSYRVDKGPQRRCGLLSQGRVLRPLKIESFKRCLDESQVRWQEDPSCSPELSPDRVRQHRESG